MEKFSLNVEIEAENEQEVAQIFDSLSKIRNSMSHEDFIHTADFIAEHPDVVDKIKNLVANPPLIMKNLMNSLF